MRPHPPIIRPANHGQFPAPTSSASTAGLRGSVTGMNSAFTPLAPLERWISYTQAEIVSIRSDLIQHLQAEIMKLRSDLISYHKQFADYQKICQSQLDVLTQQVRQSNQTMTEIQSSIIDLQNTQTEFARNIEDVYRKLISLSSQLHGRSPPETQTVPPPNTGGIMQALLGEDQIQTSPCPEPQQRTSADLIDPIGFSLGTLQQDGADQATTPKSGPPPNPYAASVQRTQMDNTEFGPSPAPRALTDIFDLSTQPY